MDAHAIPEQAAALRLVDPHAALAALEAAVPGLAALRRIEPARIDWAAVEAALGTALPADFKLFGEVYPPLLFGDFMSIQAPTPGREEAWAKATLAEREDVEDLLDIEGLSDVLPVYPDPGGLLGWGGSHDGDTFLWTTAGASPEEWKVTVASHNGDWWHYPAGAVQFTADLISGAVEPWGLPSVRPEVVTAGD
ncbi:SMI1/KNR4 family protein [Streptomyces sp. NPDC058067]|uniref:SMI1/KNR4 family protein n=1 Tax=Streptomyces sp. NPDC058067 TaxID=3346324 RepID=UPI0036EB4CC0